MCEWPWLEEEAIEAAVLATSRALVDRKSERGRWARGRCGGTEAEEDVGEGGIVPVRERVDERREGEVVVGRGGAQPSGGGGGGDELGDSGGGEGGDEGIDGEVIVGGQGAGRGRGAGGGRQWARRGRWAGGIWPTTGSPGPSLKGPGVYAECEIVAIRAVGTAMTMIVM